MKRKDRELEEALVEEMAALRPERLRELVERVESTRPVEATHDIMELKGLGKDFWRSRDVEQYIREERDSWR